MKSSARFWDRIAERYSNKPVPDEAVYQEKLASTRRYLTPESRVVEIGCGTGSTAIAHAPHVRHIRAVDISGEMIKIAQRKASDAGIANVDFEQGSVEDLVAPDESVDVVLALSLLHLVEDPDAVIGQVRRMLKPGGVFVSGTVCIGDSMKFFRYVGPIGRMLGVMPYVNVFTKQALLDSFDRHRFSIDHDWQPGKRTGVFVVARKQ